MVESRSFCASRGPAAHRVPARARAVVLVLMLGIAGVLGWVSSPAPGLAAGASQVTIDNFTFSPATLTVPAGTTITWTNRDEIPHTVREDHVGFKSSTLDTGVEYSHTLSTP